MRSWSVNWRLHEEAIPKRGNCKISKNTMTMKKAHIPIEFPIPLGVYDLLLV